MTAYRSMSDVTAMELRAVAYDHPDAVVLVSLLQRHYLAVYGEEDPRHGDPGEYRPPRGLFLVGYLDGRPVACGGWRAKDAGEWGFQDGDAELKRAYVVEELAGLQMLGAAHSILTAVESAAIRARRRRAILDVGVKQVTAMRFFERAGYTRIPNYGVYRDDPQTICYAKALR
ncbi:GNAT family N-acetyltransferase [Micromonospora sp. NPDC049282]|uniref:GNAT family N-acetyltransferase n=1 Tax=Micromonospora sp. NPDC049282 TaxID=3364269 RepID=UPI00371266FB